MNRNIAFILIILIFVCCRSIKPLVISVEEEQIMKIIKIPKKMEHRKFNIETFDTYKDESDYWHFTDKDGFEVVQFDLGDAFVERRKKHKDLFEEYYVYYENGNLKQEARCFINNGFLKGKGYFYDLMGRLEEVIDYDIPYKYTWENVLDFVKKNKIKLYDTHTLIQRYKDKEKGYCWWIRWKMPWEQKVCLVMLSGEDGRILDKKIGSFKR